MKASWKVTSVAIGVSLMVLAGSGLPASASDNDSGGRGAISDIDQVAPNVFKNLADATRGTEYSALTAAIDGVSVTVPKDAARGISMSDGSRTLSIGLPSNGATTTARTSNDGVVSYDNLDGSVIVPVVKSDGTIQITTVSKNANSPSRFGYKLGLPEGASAKLDASGAVLIESAPGSILGVIAPPWAVDANGANVPTHYELNGQTLTQYVDLKAPGVVFPVVADPTITLLWWGYTVKYTKAETKSIANQGGPSFAASLLCSFITVPVIRVTCIAASAYVISLYWNAFKSAAHQGKCAQLNIPYTPPVPPIVYTVTC